MISILRRARLLFGGVYQNLETLSKTKLTNMLTNITFKTSNSVKMLPSLFSTSQTATTSITQPPFKNLKLSVYVLLEVFSYSKGSDLICLIARLNKRLRNEIQGSGILD